MNFDKIHKEKRYVGLIVNFCIASFDLDPIETLLKKFQNLFFFFSLSFVLFKIIKLQIPRSKSKI
jgi:hypothetical protein